MRSKIFEKYLEMEGVHTMASKSRRCHQTPIRKDRDESEKTILVGILWITDVVIGTGFQRLRTGFRRC